MNVDLPLPRRFARRGRVRMLFLFLLLLLPASAAAAEAHRPAPPVRVASLSAHAVSAPLVLSAWSWQKVWSPFEATLSNRRRMIQLATIGMCIGLYILMRK